MFFTLEKKSYKNCSTDRFFGEPKIGTSMAFFQKPLFGICILKSVEHTFVSSCQDSQGGIVVTLLSYS